VSNKTLAELGENESLKRVIARLRSSTSAQVGPGDDAAVVSLSENRFVVTTDTMIEDHDFKLDWSTGFDLGFKAAATNLSDVAAMGAKPTALVVALAVPSSTSIDWLESFADGLNAALEQLAPDASVVGGDLAAAEKVFISVTAHGDLEGRKPVLRSGAQVGDVLAVAGSLGKAAAGLDLLRVGGSARDAFDELVEIQLRPIPPVDLGVVAAHAGANSMLDISDSLVKDAARISNASKVSLNIEASMLLGYQAILEQAAIRLDVDSLNWILFGGEDHSLLATFSSAETVPKGFKVIGQVIAQTDTPVLLDMQPIAEKGWDSVNG